MRRRYEDRLESILREGEATGAFAVSDSRITVMAIIAMLTGVNTWYRRDGRLSLAEIEDIYWDLVRRAVVPG